MSAATCEKGYVKGDKLSILDILVWCDLYPLATDKIFRKRGEFIKMNFHVRLFYRINGGGGENTTG